MKIKIRNLTKIYKSKVGDICAVNNVSLDFESNGFYSIIGKSGSGKSTLVNCLLGMLSFDDGAIYFDEEDISGFDANKWDYYRLQNISILRQNINLIENLSIKDNLTLILDSYGIDKADHRRLIEEYMNLLNISESIDKKVNSLSEGQKQRICLIVSLLKDTDVIVFDEPTSALDEENSRLVFDILENLSKSKLVIVISHSIDYVYRYSNVIIEMVQGEVVKSINKRNQRFIHRNTDSTVVNSMYDLNLIVNRYNINEITLSLLLNEQSQEVLFNFEQIKYNKTNITFNNFITAAIYNIKNNIFHRVLSIFILGVITSLLLLLGTIYFHNVQVVVEEYVQKNKIHAYEVFSYISYEDDDGGDVGNIVKWVCEYIENMMTQVGIEYMKSDSLYLDDLNTDIILIYIDCNISVDDYCNLDNNDILIHKAFAEIHNISIGDLIWINDEEFIVRNILDTNINGKDFISNEVFTKKRKYETPKKILFYGIDVTLLPEKNMESYVNVSNVSQLEYPTQLSDNEILVTETFWNTLVRGEIEFIPNTSFEIMFPDIHKIEYQYNYTDIQSLYNYFPKGASIIGVVEDNVLGEIFVNNDIFNEMVYDHENYYSYESIYVYNIYEHDLHLLFNKDIHFNNYDITHIHNINDVMKNELRNTVLYSVIVFIIMLIISGVGICKLLITQNHSKYVFLRINGVGKNIVKKFLLSDVLVVVLLVWITSYVLFKTYLIKLNSILTDVFVLDLNFLYIQPYIVICTALLLKLIVISIISSQVNKLEYTVFN